MSLVANSFTVIHVLIGLVSSNFLQQGLCFSFIGPSAAIFLLLKRIRLYHEIYDFYDLLDSGYNFKVNGGPLGHKTLFTYYLRFYIILLCYVSFY